MLFKHTIKHLLTAGVRILEKIVSFMFDRNKSSMFLTLKLPTTTTVAQPFNVIKWQLKFNLVA